MRFFNLYTREN